MTCRHTQFKPFSIWSPRYHDNRVLLNAYKIGEHNKITFTQAPSMGEEPYYVSGKNVKKYKKESNGSIMCFSVPLEELKPLELEENCEHLYK